MSAGLGAFLQTAGGGALGGAAISAVAGLAGSIGSGRKAYHRSKNLMKLQRDLDKEMWDYQNKYNLPSAQMQRLKEAGLNPALMYGQGTTGNASNAPQTKFTQLNPYMNAGDIGTLANAGIQMALANATKRDLDASADVKETQAKRNTVLTAKDRKEIRLIERKIVNMDSDTALKLRQTSNLKTVNDYDKLRVQLEEQVVKRAKKGIIKGDNLGNVLELFGLDPVGNKDHRTWLIGAFGAWYGSVIARNLAGALGSIIPMGKNWKWTNPHMNK